MLSEERNPQEHNISTNAVHVSRKLAPISSSQINNNKIRKIKRNSTNSGKTLPERSSTQEIYYAPDNSNHNISAVSASLNSLLLNNQDPDKTPSYSDTVYGYYTVEKT